MVFNGCIQLTDLNGCVFAVVFNSFCEKAENAFFQPNPSISEIAVNLRLKRKRNISFRMLFCVFAYLTKLNLP